MNAATLRRIVEAERREAAEHGRPFSARFLVERAKNRDHPLHGQLWGTAEAELAMAQRVWLAGQLIRRVEIVVVDRDEGRLRIPYLVRDRSLPEAGYVETMSLRGNREAAVETILAELGLLRGIRTRIVNLAAALDLQHEVADAMQGLDELHLIVQQFRASQKADETHRQARKRAKATAGKNRV